MKFFAILYVLFPILALLGGGYFWSVDMGFPNAGDGLNTFEWIFIFSAIPPTVLYFIRGIQIIGFTTYPAEEQSSRLLKSNFVVIPAIIIVGVIFSGVSGSGWGDVIAGIYAFLAAAGYLILTFLLHLANKVIQKRSFGAGEGTGFLLYVLYLMFVFTRSLEALTRYPY